MRTNGTDNSNFSVKSEHLNMEKENFAPTLRACGLSLPDDFRLELVAGSREAQLAQAFVEHLGELAHGGHEASPARQHDALLGLLVVAMRGLPEDNLPASRTFVLEAFRMLGRECPPRYEAMLAHTPHDEVIAGLRPWFFMSSPGRSVGYCSAAARQPVLPFCQALEQDLVACFLPESPQVVLINPWAVAPQDVLRQTFTDYDAWLAYAHTFSAALAQLENEGEHTAKNELDFVALSRMVSHALRHEPWLYELELDPEGWVTVPDLIRALTSQDPKYASLTEADLAEMTTRLDKQRHEVTDGRIRALYGHSTPQKLQKTRATPPAVLYHGTSPEVAQLILSDGLKPMGRQFVHLSPDPKTAMKVGARKAAKPVLLTVRADQADGAGVPFYRGNDKVWLADAVPAQFIEPGVERGRR